MSLRTSAGRSGSARARITGLASALAAIALAVGAVTATSNAAAGQITGVVSVPAGRIGDVVVELTAFTGTTHPTATVAADGSYTIPWTGACSYVRARSVSGLLIVATTPRRVCPGESAPTLTLTAAGIITGKVSNAITAGVNRTAVSAVLPNGNLARSVPVAADGTYQLTGLPAGSYYVATDIWDGGARPATSYWAPARQTVYAAGVSESAMLDKTALSATGVKAFTVAAGATVSAGSMTAVGGGTATSTLTCPNGTKAPTALGTAWPIQYTDTPGNDLLSAREIASTGGVAARGLADTDYLIQVSGCPAVAGGKWGLDVYSGNTLHPALGDTVYAPPGTTVTFGGLDQRTARLFTDVTAKTTFVGEMQWAVEQGIITDNPAGAYKPTTAMRRDVMAAYLYRLAGEPAWTAPTTSPFVDMTPSSPYYKEVTWLAKTGVTTGWQNANRTWSYRPSIGVNRDVMAAFFYRYVGRPAWTAPAKSPFADMTPTSPFYKEVTWLAATGVTTGWTEANGTKTFRPTTAVNRDMMSAFLFRLDWGVDYRTIKTGTGSQIAGTAFTFTGHPSTDRQPSPAVARRVSTR